MRGRKTVNTSPFVYLFIFWCLQPVVSVVSLCGIKIRLLKPFNCERYKPIKEEAIKFTISYLEQRTFLPKRFTTYEERNEFHRALTPDLVQNFIKGI